MHFQSVVVVELGVAAGAGLEVFDVAGRQLVVAVQASELPRFLGVFLLPEMGEHRVDVFRGVVAQQLPIPPYFSQAVGCNLWEKRDFC